MKRFGRTMILVLTLFGAAALGACDGAGGASCGESCSADDECGSGLMCGGGTCVPDGCSACSGGTCHYEENTQEQEQGEMASCSFRECS